ncbi:hypothetical protein AALT_g11822 [Alternaria alternata]|nr:hypothetical protein AALT_g11822 [Alternaria alternata]
MTDTTTERSLPVQGPRNVLILKGNVVTEALELLDELMRRIGEQMGQKPEPWHLFSFICASGASGPLAVFLGPGQQTTTDYRNFLSILGKKSDILSEYPSNMASRKAWLDVKGRLPERFLEKSREEHRCEAYIWNFYYSDQSPNHVETKDPDETLEESFFRAGNVEEYPQCDGQDGPNTRSPLHGLIEAAETNRQHHNESCYVSIRECARDEHELEKENKDLKSFGPHFAFVIQGSQKFNIHTHEEMLKATAVELVEWLKSDERLNNG